MDSSGDSRKMGLTEPARDGSLSEAKGLDRPTLSARIPNCDLVMTLWGEDAQLHTANGQSVYRKERWDFSTPQESVAGLTNSVASHLRTESKK